MSIIAIQAFQDNYIWIIKQTASFICIDPGDASPVLAFAAQEHLTLTDILVTHLHADHIGGVNTLREQFPDVSVHMPNEQATQVTCEPYHFDVLQTPGHTQNHICYFEPFKHWLFCGDTLFSAGCGRVFDGSMKALFASLNTLKALPNDTQVFCAHEYTRQNLRFAQTVEPDNATAATLLEQLDANPSQISLPSTIEREKAINPFFRLDAPSIQASTQKSEPFEVFRALREAKDCF